MKLLKGLRIQVPINTRNPMVTEGNAKLLRKVKTLSNGHERWELRFESGLFTMRVLNPEIIRLADL